MPMHRPRSASAVRLPGSTRHAAAEPSSDCVHAPASSLPPVAATPSPAEPQPALTERPYSPTSERQWTAQAASHGVRTSVVTEGPRPPEVLLFEQAHRTCPGCSADMVDRGCKLRCPRCGFFLDCSDG